MRRLFARMTVPDDGSSSPIRMRNKVVLPMPLGPTNASRAPLATENETPENKSSAPKDLESELTVISDIIVEVFDSQSYLITNRVADWAGKVSTPSAENFCKHRFSALWVASNSQTSASFSRVP